MKKYIYILSQRYSGSTLLTFLLSTHPEIATIGERRKFYNKVIRAEDFQHHKAKHCSCGKLFIECEYLNDIKEHVLKEVNPSIFRTNGTELKIHNNKYLNRIAYEIHKRTLPLGFSPFSTVVKEHQELNKILVEKILNKDRSSAFLDSSKIINHALYLSQIQEFDFYAIWLVRDPRAQINSAMKYHQWSVQKATASWKKEMENNENILNKFKIKHIVLSYSALCADPTKEISKLLEFTKLDPKQFSLDFRDQEHHIMGNHMRLQKDQTIQERTEWKQSLSSKDIQYITKETQKYSAFYSE